MRFRILRWIRAHAITGRRQYREIFIQARRLTIGRASDQHLQIADAAVFPNHAVIRPGRGREGPLVIEALTPSGVRVNNKVHLLKNLQPGDEIVLGPAVITLVPVEKGAPVTLRFRLVEQDDGGSSSRLDRLHVLSLSESGLSKRFWSLVLASGVAAIFLLVPMSAALYQPLRPLLRASSLIPNDSLWTPGALHASHQFIGADCNACHTSPFTRVENTQCAVCHTNVQHHVKVPSADMVLFEQRCGECHVEHGEKRSLVSRNQDQCTDCHANLDEMKPRTKIANASDFGSDHPEFKLTVLQSGVKGSKDDWQPALLNLLPGVKAAERSHLSFSHTEHLDRRGIKGPRGDEVLTCEDCHQPDVSGRNMLPVQMEKQCSRCHSLRFDETDPSSEVPHGDLEGLYRTLISHFSRQYLEGTTAQAPRSRSQARRPGGEALSLSRDQQRRALDWAERQSLSAARDLFEKRVCVDCHEVSKVPGAVGFQQWKVEPVRLTQNWMPRAQFDHASHKTTTCITCHVEANNSKLSTDILMPTITECRTCHSGGNDHDKLPSDCLMCHQFHIPNRGLFDADATMRARSLPAADALRRVDTPRRKERASP